MSILAIITTQLLYGQRAELLNFSHISYKNGLTSINVRKIRKDSKGFIWAGSQDGLFRYDGDRFWEYNKNLNVKFRITGPDIRDLLFVNDTLWVLNSFGGIDAINTISGNVILSWHQQLDNRFKDVYFSSFTKSNNQLFLSGSNGLYRFDIKRRAVEKVELRNPQGFSITQKLNISNLGISSDSHLWLFTTTGVLVINLPDLTVEALHHSDIITFCHQFTGSNHVITGTETGIQEYDFNGSELKKTVSRLSVIPGATEPVYAISSDSAGNIWFSNKNNLVKSSAYGKEFITINATNKPDGANWMASVFEIYFTSDNELWLGCQEGIAYTDINPPKFISYRKSTNTEVTIGHAYFIFPLNDSIIYVCAEDGLYKTNTSTGIITAIDKGKPYFYVFRGPKNRLAASSSEGTFFIDKQITVPLRSVYPELPENKLLVLSSHIQVGDSIFIFGTQNDKGVLFWDVKNKNARIINDVSPGLQLRDNNINGIYQAHSGMIWILTDKSVMIYDIIKKRINPLPLQNPVTKKNYSIFFDFCETPENYYIASYSNGIIVLDKQLNFVKEISTADGLSNNGVYKLLLYRDSLLFATSNNGLSVIDIGNNRVKTYFTESGLHSNNFEEFSGNTFGNTVYAGGSGGFTEIRPLNFSINKKSPLLYFTGVQIKTDYGITDTFNLAIEKIVIPNNATQTIVYFSGINYKSPKRSVFFYKVTELHKEWIQSDQQHSISLIGLTHGTYHLQVQAFNEDGIPSEIKTLTLIFLPKWYQTLFFKILVGLAIFALAWAFYRLRINQLKKEQRIRTKLASDLHDDLGSTMNSVKLYANLAMMEYPSGKYPPLIIHSTQEAITGIRDMIWVLDDSKDSVEDLLMRISNFATPLCEANQVHYVQDFSDEARNHKLGQEERRNLYMMLKETINNAIKYAGGSTITLTASVRKGKPAFSISDNGKGFDTTLASEGNGLKNLHRRAAEIKYRLHLESAPGAGTSIRIEKE